MVVFERHWNNWILNGKPFSSVTKLLSCKVLLQKEIDVTKLGLKSSNWSIDLCYYSDEIWLNTVKKLNYKNIYLLFWCLELLLLYPILWMSNLAVIWYIYNMWNSCQLHQFSKSDYLIIDLKYSFKSNQWKNSKDFKAL